MNKIEALAEYLELDEVDIVEEYGQMVTEDGDYIVCTEDEGRELAMTSIIDLFDDIGVFGLSDLVSAWAMDTVEDGWFDDVQKESHEAYAEDIQSEESSDDDLYANRLHEELVDAGLMDAFDEDESDTMDDLASEAEGKIDELADYMMENDSVEWFKNNFGEDELSTTVKKNNLVDEEELAEMIIDSDGVANTLSSYDGEEIDLGSFYAYRTN